MPIVINKPLSQQHPETYTPVEQAAINYVHALIKQYDACRRYDSNQELQDGDFLIPQNVLKPLCNNVLVTKCTLVEAVKQLENL